MVQTRIYSLVVELHQDQAGYLAHFPALRGCHTWGGTYEEAVAYAEEALIGYLEARAKSGQNIPVEDRPVREVSLALMVHLPTNI